MARQEKFPIKKVIGFDQGLLDALDAYRREQEAIPNVSEAIRALLTESLRDKGYLPTQNTTPNDDGE